MMAHPKTELLLALLFVATATASMARATPPNGVQCGDVLGPGGSYRLSEDLDCDVSPALTVLDGAILNLGGHTLTCGPYFPPTGFQTGIQMEGQNASVANGTILECDAGVVLAGVGKHSVSRIEYAHSSPGTHVAFAVQSDGNLLVRNSATACDGCFEIQGDGNRLMHNVAFDGPGVGFWMYPSADNNQLLYNVAESQYAEGFIIAGHGNELIKNEATDTLFENGAGFEVSGENKLRRNIATDNAGYGFKVLSGVSLIGNTAEDNKKSGITVSGTDNAIIRNTAFGNGDGVQYFDLNDDNLGCDNNTWNKNKFDTRNTDCIK